MKTVAIAAAQSPTREGLQVLLTPLAAVYVVEQTSVPGAGTQVVSPPPDLLVLDYGPHGERAALLAQLQRLWPHTPCVVLVDRVEQQAALQTHAGACTASLTVLVKGVSATRLFQQIESLLGLIEPAELPAHEERKSDNEYPNQ